MFHDLGLAESQESIDGAISFSDQVFEAHPQLSRDLLSQLPEVTPAMLETVLNHHENLDGSGFPRGLSGDQLGPSDRLARIADLYESLTSGCFGDPLDSAYQALNRMRRELQLALDQEMLEKFVRFLGQT